MISIHFIFHKSNVTSARWFSMEFLCITFQQVDTFYIPYH